jgi:glycosyltransferase involved in cell wall biosynthesis
MNIFHVIAQLRFGAGRYVVDAAIEQARGLKQKVMICVSDDVDNYWRTDPKLVSELACYGIEVKYIGDFFHRKPELIHGSAATLRKLLAEASGKTIVHAHTAIAAAVGQWAAPDGLVAACHGWGFNRPPEFDLQDSLAYQLCDVITTFSEHWANRLMKNLAASDPKIIRIGLDLKRYPQHSQKAVNTRGPFRIVTACELTYRKGVDILLRAMAEVWKEIDDVELHIMGDGDAMNTLKRDASVIDPEKKRIKFHGIVENPYSEFAKYDLFVLSSRSDNLPVILLEAMLARLPIISTAVGGVPELIGEAQSGRIIPPESAEALAGAIVEMLKKNRNSMISIGKKGERFARRELDVRQTAKELNQIYLASIKKRRAGQFSKTLS